MTSISIELARTDIDGVLNRVIAGSEAIVVESSAGGSVVMMPLDDFSSWQETAYLLGNPANAAHLRKSVEDVRQGRFVERPLDEQ